MQILSTLSRETHSFTAGNQLFLLLLQFSNYYLKFIDELLLRHISIFNHVFGIGMSMQMTADVNHPAKSMCMCLATKKEETELLARHNQRLSNKFSKI